MEKEAIVSPIHWSFGGSGLLSYAGEAGRFRFATMYLYGIHTIVPIIGRYGTYSSKNSMGISNEVPSFDVIDKSTSDLDAHDKSRLDFTVFRISNEFTVLSTLSSSFADQAKRRVRKRYAALLSGRPTFYFHTTKHGKSGIKNMLHSTSIISATVL